MGVVDLDQGVGGGTRGGHYLIVCLFFLFVLSHILSLFQVSRSMIAVVSVSLFSICFLCLWSL